MSQRRTFEQMREYFADPRKVESVADLKKLSGEAIEVMAWIFASGGICLVWLPR